MSNSRPVDRSLRRQFPVVECDPHHQGHGALRRGRAGGDRSRLRAARAATGRAAGVVGGVGRARGADRAPRRRRRQRGKKHTAGDQYLRAGHYSLQRGAVHPSRCRKAPMGGKGLPVLARRHSPAPSEHRARRGAVRAHDASSSVHESRGVRPGTDRRDSQWHGQRQGDEHLFCRARIRPPRHATRSPWTGRVRAKCLRLRDIHSRYDYEVPGTAAYDYVTAGPTSTPGVLPSWATASAAIIPRALPPSSIAMPPASPSLHCIGTWPPGRPASRNGIEAIRNRWRSRTSNFNWVVNAATPDDAIEIARKFSLTDVAANIACPFLVTHGGNDRVVPVENARKLHDGGRLQGQGAQDFFGGGRRSRARPCR